MSPERITASDIIDWDSLGDVMASFEKRGLVHRPDMGTDNERVMELDEDEILRTSNAIQYRRSTPLFETLRDRSRRALGYVREIV